MSKRIPLYNKFIDEHNVSSLFKNHLGIACKLPSTFVFFMLFSYVPACILSITGYSPSVGRLLIDLSFALVFVILAIFFGIRYCYIMIKYSIARKKIYPVLLISTQSLLMMMFCAIPYWTTIIERTEYAYLIHPNILPALLYMALSIGMFVFHAFAVGNCFEKYIRPGSKQNEENL